TPYPKKALREASSHQSLHPTNLPLKLELLLMSLANVNANFDQVTMPMESFNLEMFNLLVQGGLLPSFQLNYDGSFSFCNLPPIFDTQGLGQSFGPDFLLNQLLSATTSPATSPVIPEIQTVAVNEVPFLNVQEPITDLFSFTPSEPSAIDFSDSEISSVSSPTLSTASHGPERRTRNRKSNFEPSVMCSCGTSLKRILHIRNHLMKSRKNCKVVCIVKNCGYEMTKSNMKHHLETAHPIIAKRNPKALGSSE
ncbi:hypothetical protein HDU99_001821, partial [Rhizoclosmatium hyalinum]